MNEHLKKRLAVTFDTSVNEGDREEKPVLAQCNVNTVIGSALDDSIAMGYKLIYRETGFRSIYLTGKGVEMPTIRHLVFLWRITKCEGKLGASVVDIASKGLYMMHQTSKILIRRRLIEMNDRGYLSVGSRVNRQGKSVLIYSLTGRGMELVEEYLAWMGGLRDHLLKWD